jgi:hypothetical protein
MKNITESVTDKAWREARVWAAEHDTSLSRIVQYFISSLPGLKSAGHRFPLSDDRARVQNPSSTATNSDKKPRACS